jgi:lysosomal alpha-mannosidase
MIEFEVSLAEIPIDDYQGRDVIVNWHMFDDFDAKKTFWTDSNGLEMQERHLRDTKGKAFNYIGKNYYPVDSAIAMRDTKKNVQVTVMNDRAQGGTADIVKGSIELMQNRRLT